MLNSKPIEITPLVLPFDHEPDLPGSKSIANRALVLAALYEGLTDVVGAGEGDDVRSMVENLRILGFDVQGRGGDYRVQGGIPKAPGTGKLDCGAGGTTLRYLLALAALCPGEWSIDGSERLRRRPIEELVTALGSLGARIEAKEGRLPLRVLGGGLHGGTIGIDASRSSQFLSALLLIAPALPQGLVIDVSGRLASASYVALTLSTLEKFGVPVLRRGNRFDVGETKLESPGTYVVETDWSAAGAWLVIERLTRSRLRLPRLDWRSAQPDSILPSILDALEGDGPRTIEVSSCPDQLMNLAVFAARRVGPTRFTGAGTLNLKESERLVVLERELGRAGVSVSHEVDELIVKGPAQLRPATLEPESDHRMAMAFAIMGLMHPGIVVRDPGCVSKSYPGFFEELAGLVDRPRAIALVGMRGAGKSTLAAELGKQLRLEVIDLDRVFESRCGPIGEFVRKEGWPRFREIEEALVREHLAPRRVLALGGGAIESHGIRRALAAEAITVWVQEFAAILSQRVGASSRPSVTSNDPVEEIGALMARRDPLHRAAADLVLPAGVGIEERVEACRKGLNALCSW